MREIKFSEISEISKKFKKFKISIFSFSTSAPFPNPFIARMSELAIENKNLTEKLEREAYKSRKLKAKLKNKCNRLERQKQHHLKHCKHKANCNCSFHAPLKNTNVKIMRRENKAFYLISNDGENFKTPWSLVQQSSTVSILLKRFNMAFNEPKKVSLWLPNLRGSVIELVLMWYFRQDDEQEVEELMAGLDEGELQDFGAAADYGERSKIN